MVPAWVMSQNASVRRCLAMDAALAVVRANVAGFVPSSADWYLPVSALIYPARDRAAGLPAMRIRVGVVGMGNTVSVFRRPTCHVYAPGRVMRVRKSLIVV